MTSFNPTPAKKSLFSRNECLRCIDRGVSGAGIEPQHDNRLPEETGSNLPAAFEKGVRMYILRIEHPVNDFDGWKKAFDSDPVGRQRSGVRRYRILRPVDDSNYIMIDLEFDSASQAEALLAALRGVWKRVDGKIMINPKVRVVEAVETKEY